LAGQVILTTETGLDASGLASTSSTMQSGEPPPPACNPGLMIDLQIGYPETYKMLHGEMYFDGGKNAEWSAMSVQMRQRVMDCTTQLGDEKLKQIMASKTPEQLADDQAFVEQKVAEHVAQKIAEGSDPDDIAVIVHSLTDDPQAVYEQAQEILDAREAASRWIWYAAAGGAALLLFLVVKR